MSIALNFKTLKVVLTDSTNVYSNVVITALSKKALFKFEYGDY